MQGIFNIFLFVLFVYFMAFTLYAIPLLILYLILVFAGADKRLHKAKDKLQSTLMKDEVLHGTGIQKRPFAFFSRRKVVAITNSRVVSLSRGLLGGFTMQDFQWKDLADVQMSENVLPGVCGNNLSFQALGQQVMLPGIEREAALNIYQQAQSQEQAWEEKRRVRVMEEHRAASGGFSFQAGAAHAMGAANVSGSPAAASVSVTDELEKIKRLLDSGAINDAEYNEIKAKLLAKLV